MDVARSKKRKMSARMAAGAMLSTATVVGSMLIGAQPASAGFSVCLGLWAEGGVAKLQHRSSCGPNGTYHVEIWGGGHHDNGNTYTYSGNLREFRANWPVPAGTTVCARLWRHKPGGGYDDWGLPCDKM